MTIHSDKNPLKLENQLCFRLYSLNKLINRLYAPVLNKLSLTYPQYLVMLVLWEADDAISVKALGQRLDLDSGTLSPLLKRMESQALISRYRDSEDERSVKIQLTSSGKHLKVQAKSIPSDMFSQTGFSMDEMMQLTGQLDNLLDNLSDNKNEISN